MDVLLTNLYAIFTAQILDIGGTKFSIATISSLLGLIVLAFFVSRIISEIIRRSLLTKLRINRGLQEAITVFIKYLLITLSSVIILQTAGIDLSSLAVIAGVVGIGIGFGLQNIASNFISGLVLLFEQTIKVGDYVEIGELKGTIEKISIRSTIIRTEDDLFVIVPNQRFIENNTVNWSYAGHTCRIHIPVSVAYDTDLLVLTEALLTSARHEPRVLSNPPPEVWFLAFGRESLEFELLVWIDDPDANEPIRSSINFRIAYEFRSRGIRIPFPTREIILHNPEAMRQIIAPPNPEEDRDQQLQNTKQINSVLSPASNEISTKSLRDLLRKISYFERCTELELFALIARGYRKHFDISEIICRENDPSEEFYIILSGVVEIFSEKNNQAIATLSEGEFFGEISLLIGMPRTATVRALTVDTVLFVVERQQLQKLLSEHKELGEQIALKLSERQQVLISLGLLNEEELQRSQYAALSWVRDRLNNIFGINLGKNP
ncbi:MULTISPECIES: mechanosensitive ion channel domain-containing protein [Pseudanabaena]|jgi:potassium-dependent mechanosensitive channel|uniref:mechanosensitive ion channel domain-containing protein n=1 Tax=Pseudanabaena TaxID=1152 RepID=UPI002478589A|nr:MULTISPECIES: mechanosensitive ion channel domain-containing protein [Pseudanabaena]MEA5486996.1 mechanosensitive ion channel domain-containing protein [Pseudanabaena sp. CCNP1317]WGS72441.1 mechanosensitive ion channel [Pseudanabaena galeata CCNP1313]